MWHWHLPISVSSLEKAINSPVCCAAREKVALEEAGRASEWVIACGGAFYHTGREEREEREEGGQAV